MAPLGCPKSIMILDEDLLKRRRAQGKAPDGEDFEPEHIGAIPEESDDPFRSFDAFGRAAKRLFEELAGKARDPNLNPKFTKFNSGETERAESTSDAARTAPDDRVAEEYFFLVGMATGESEKRPPYILPPLRGPETDAEPSITQSEDEEDLRRARLSTREPLQTTIEVSEQRLPRPDEGAEILQADRFGQITEHAVDDSQFLRASLSASDEPRIPVGRIVPLFLEAEGSILKPNVERGRARILSQASLPVDDHVLGALEQAQSLLAQLPPIPNLADIPANPAGIAQTTGHPPGNLQSGNDWSEDFGSVDFNSPSQPAQELEAARAAMKLVAASSLATAHAARGPLEDHSRRLAIVGAALAADPEELDSAPFLDGVRRAQAAVAERVRLLNLNEHELALRAA